MKIFPPDLSLKQNNIACTVGNFDGVHKGHLALIKKLKEKGDYAVVVTFSNHPSEVLRKHSTPLLTSVSHKCDLLSKEGIDEIVLLSFSAALSQLSPEDFLQMLRLHIPFSHLILGHDAVIGHRRTGNQTCLKELSHKLGFSLEYLSPVLSDKEIISSSRIRHLLKMGKLEAANRSLGRAYALRGPLIKGAGLGKQIGFPTLNIDVKDGILPPYGVYAVSVHGKRGIANLGVAPTLQKRDVQLEVHLLEKRDAFEDKVIEVQLLHFLRSEKKFPSKEALQKQILDDILSCRRYLTN